MTDEELAEKYVTDTGNNDCTIEAYIAGLKAGRDMAEADLKKEKAKLRKDREELCHVISECAKACLYPKEQLIKAGELLNEFIRISEACDEDFEHDFTELIGETEQFLREIEQC